MSLTRRLPRTLAAGSTAAATVLVPVTSAHAAGAYTLAVLPDQGENAKAIVADYGTATAKGFAGSENFSDNSLNHNRELGLVIADPAVLPGIESTITADFDRVPGTANGTTVATRSDLDHSTGYAQHTVDLSAYAGQSVTLTFSGTEDHTEQTSFVLDDLALNAS
ncbi:hypothetical protein ABZ747_13895 [Kitasatospora cineracea]|uniref:hypothetical protein n=1 Tax=Kitasatospora cineracea TaxID=88074 RepID=UPI0033CD09BE